MLSAVNTVKAMSGYTPAEEFASALIHGLGAVAALIVLVLLLGKAMPVLPPWELAGVGVYGMSLVALFVVSTLYHAVESPTTKDVLKRIDHGAIFVVIAGTYTPFMTITLQSSTARVLLAVIWSLAVAGIVFKIFFVHRFRWPSLGTYLAMGWSSIVVVWELWQRLPRPGFMLLVAGGLCFTVGAVFYSLKSIRYTHAIWHVWVVAGVACHAASIGYYVIPSVESVR